MAKPPDCKIFLDKIEKLKEEIKPFKYAYEMTLIFPKEVFLEREIHPCLVVEILELIWEQLIH